MVRIEIHNLSRKPLLVRVASNIRPTNHDLPHANVGAASAAHSGNRLALTCQNQAALSTIEGLAAIATSIHPSIVTMLPKAGATCASNFSGQVRAIFGLNDRCVIDRLVVRDQFVPSTLLAFVYDGFEWHERQDRVFRQK